jgi:hypothetical protein
LLCRLLANAPFYCCKHLLHRRICLRSLLILTPFWALFSLVLPRGSNSEGQPKKHLLPAHRRRLLWSFLLYSTTGYVIVESLPFPTYRIWLLRLTLDVCMSNENFLQIDFLVCPNFRWNHWVRCLTSTVLRRWGVVVNFALLSLLFLLVFALLEGNLIAIA